MLNVRLFPSKYLFVHMDPIRNKGGGGGVSGMFVFHFRTAGYVRLYWLYGSHAGAVNRRCLVGIGPMGPSKCLVIKKKSTHQLILIYFKYKKDGVYAR